LIWLVIFDNPKGRYPQAGFRTMLNNFLNSLKKYTTIETIMYSDNKFMNIELKYRSSNKELIINERSISSNNVDGVIISMTEQGINKIIESNQVRNELLNILNRIKNEAPLVFCSGKRAFNNIKNTKFLNNFNVFYQQKIGINWFNYHLKDYVLKKIIK